MDIFKDLIINIEHLNSKIFYNIYYLKIKRSFTVFVFRSRAHLVADVDLAVNFILGELNLEPANVVLPDELPLNSLNLFKLNSYNHVGLRRDVYLYDMSVLFGYFILKMSKNYILWMSKFRCVL